MDTNRAGLLRMIESAGFEILEATPVYILPTGPRHPKPKPKPKLREMPSRLGTAKAREELIVSFRGIPHVAARVRPIAS